MTSKVLGGGSLDGSLGLNPDWINIEAPLNRQLWSIDDQGSLVGWIVGATQNPNGNLLSNGLYANPAGVVSDSDIDKEQIESNSKAIKSLLIAQGLSGNYGFFADGFTYGEVGDVGIDVDGKIYTYVGSDPLPVEVAAGTEPADDSDYSIEKFDLNSILIKSGYVFSCNFPSLQDAVNSGAGTVYLPSEVTLNSNLIVPADVSLVREGSQCVIDAAALSGNAILQAGSVRSSVSLTGDLAENDSNITLSSVIGLNVGDVIRIYSTAANSWSGTWGAANRDYRKQNIRVVTAITGSAVSLDKPVNIDFQSATTAVDVLNTTTATHKNFKILLSDSNNSRGFKIQYGYKNILEKVETEGGEVLGVEFEFGLGNLIYKSNSELLSPATTTQYTVAVSSSRNTIVMNSDLRSSRHAVAIVGSYQCENTIVENCSLYGSFPADAHGNADGYQYINCDIHGDNGIKIGGRNGAWRNCRVTSKNGTVIGAFEVHSGRFFIGEGTTIKSLSTDTLGAGWSPVDLGRGTASISSDSRGDIEFDFNGAAFTLPNLTSFFVRVQNTSAYKVNFRVDNLNVDYPTMDSLIRYEGNPAGDDADYVIFGNNIYENSTNPSLEYFKRGTDATGYDSTPIVYPTRFGPKPRSDRKGFKFGDFGEVISDGNDATIASRGTASSANDVVLAANSRFGEIVFKTGFSGSAKEFTDVAKVSNTGDIVALVTGRGLIAKSPDGTEYRLTPNNGGGSASWVAV